MLPDESSANTMSEPSKQAANNKHSAAADVGGDADDNGYTVHCQHDDVGECEFYRLYIGLYTDKCNKKLIRR